jgi:UDP-N-acetylmuramoyl-L-alanyl-D-glutamate--2,6-diaminopimelate ligase
MIDCAGLKGGNHIKFRGEGEILELEQLLGALSQPELLAAGQTGTEIKAIYYSSNEVQPDALFVAVVGFHTDGHRFISDAAQRGAVAIVGSNREKLEEFVRSPAYNGAAVVWVTDERAALNHLAAAFYGYPARKLGVIGVTGTKGKTTTSFLISQMLEVGNYSTGLIGTVDFKVGKRRWANATRQTTPEAPQVQELLSEMVAEKVEFAVIESSSHGLALRKLLDCAYDVAILTNLTHEHLEFHGTFEQYRQDKGLLFEYLSEEAPKPFLKFPKTAIINEDDPQAAYFKEVALQKAIAVLTFAIERPADVMAHSIESDARRLHYIARTPLGEVALNLHLPGRFNVYNSLAALCTGLVLGLSLDEIKRGLESVTGVPGRMETIIVSEDQPFSVIVDYAHNPDSLEQVLKVLRPLTPGKLVALFGSAGERDVAKRPMQGEVAARLADFAIFTNEDPRLEDENTIIDEIAAGAERLGWRDGYEFLKIADRRAAIEAAFAQAKPGDTILLAGKGHEQCIIMGNTKMPWDDREEARIALSRLFGEGIRSTD